MNILRDIKTKFDKDDFEGAVVSCEEALKLSGDESQKQTILSYLGYSLFQLGQFEKGEAAFLKASEITSGPQAQLQKIWKAILKITLH